MLSDIQSGSHGPQRRVSQTRLFFGIKGESGSSRGRGGHMSLPRGGWRGTSRKRDHLLSISRLSRGRFCLIDCGGTLFSLGVFRPPREIPGLSFPFPPPFFFLLPTFIRALSPRAFFFIPPRESNVIPYTGFLFSFLSFSLSLFPLLVSSLRIEEP